MSPPSAARRRTSLPALLGLALLLAASAASPATAHTLPDHASPPVGATVASAPKSVRIVFDEDLVGASCRLRVEDARERLVSGAARVDPDDPRTLEADLQPVGPGTYRVLWSVVSRDGHRTRGDYTFTVAP